MPDIFDVVADPTRREMLHILLESAAKGSGEMSVTELVSRTGLSQPTVSKQLKVLRDAGLVIVREDGQHRLYHLDPTPLEEIENWAIPFLSVPVVDDHDQGRNERIIASEFVSQAGSSVGGAAASAVFQVSETIQTLKQNTTDAFTKLTTRGRKSGRS